MSGAVHGHLGRAKGGAIDVPAAGVELNTLLSANPRSFADWNRSSGSFSRHRRTIDSRVGGMAALAGAPIASGSCLSTALIVSAGVARWNAGWPRASRTASRRARRDPSAGRPAGRAAARATCTRGFRREGRAASPSAWPSSNQPRHRRPVAARAWPGRSRGSSRVRRA